MDMLHIMDGPAVTQQALLHSRTHRSRRQLALLCSGCRSLISFTLNIPGEVKQFPLARAALEEGLHLLQTHFGTQILQQEVIHPDTGSEGLLALSLPPHAVKGYTTALEEEHPLGRLFDLDVLGADGVPLSRTALGLPPRRCLLCSQPAKLCARGRTHSMETLRHCTAQLLSDFFRDQMGRRCAAAATRALLYEVTATPKPGLVDRCNSGAHQDMDLFTFLDSSAALAPWFLEFFRLGWEDGALSLPQRFARLRHAGLGAEGAMLHVTSGVNTHKGLIFSMGLLCAALGTAAARQPGPLSLEQVTQLCAQLGGCALAQLQSGQVPDSHGAQCFHAHGVSGARGEGAQGFPTARTIGLPELRRRMAQGLSLNDAAALTLLALLAKTSDTNLIHRGGAQRAARCRTEVQTLLMREDGPTQLLSEAARLDQDYIRQGLSPGGCADLLALSLMLFFLETEGLLLP